MNLKIQGSIACYKDKTDSITVLNSRVKVGILIGYN
jgi:hypothetical protein